MYHAQRRRILEAQLWRNHEKVDGRQRGLSSRLMVQSVWTNDQPREVLYRNRTATIGVQDWNLDGTYLTASFSLMSSHPATFAAVVLTLYQA